MRSYRNCDRDPRIITAKYDSKCAETGALIRKGAECLYYSATKTVYALDTKQASDWKAWQADLAMGFDY